jgi:hypothetical protein
MAFPEIDVNELYDKIEANEDFVLVIEETRGSASEVSKTPEATIKALVKKINSFEPCSQTIYYFLNENKEEAKILLGLVTEDRTNLMYWEQSKPKFSFYFEDALEIFK